MNHLMLPPQDGRTWFIPDERGRGGEVIHDFFWGWGRYSPDGYWFSWDSGRDPRVKSKIKVGKFDKLILPVIKNMPSYPDLRDCLTQSLKSDVPTFPTKLITRDKNGTRVEVDL